MAIKNTGDSVSYGLRQVIRNGQQGDKLWPHDQRRVTNTGLVHFETDADVTVVTDVPNTHQWWDKDPGPGPGIMGPAEPGPAIAELEKRR